MPLRPRLAAALLAAALPAVIAGCTTIDEHNRVQGWPELRVIEHYVSDDAMRERCSRYVSFGMLPEACSEFNFVRGECHIWFSRDYPPALYVVRHERLHCEGYDHPGETTMRDILARYRAAQQAAARGAAAKAAVPRS